MQQKYDVFGMTCGACSAHVEQAVRKVTHVKQVQVNLLTNSMLVDGTAELTTQDILSAVEHAGYTAQVQGEHAPQAEKSRISQDAQKQMKTRLWVSFGFLIPLMYVSMGHMMGVPVPAFLMGMENAVSFALTQMLLSLPILYCNRAYFEVGFKRLWHMQPNMDSLIAVGSTAAMAYGVFALYRIGVGLGTQNMQLVMQYHMDLYFESAAMIVALITFGKYLEQKSKGKTSEAIEKLIDLAPKTATIESDGISITVPVEQVLVGDIVLVRPGQSVPVDGVVTEGSSSLDESAVTGESVPVEKTIGSAVIAASINRAGFFKFRATKVGNDTTLAQIITLVEQASASKAPIARLADAVAGVFVPIVMAIAVVTAIVWLVAGATAEFALSSAIAVLVISCPCALGLATPVAIMIGTGKGAQNGILIKSGEALERAHHVNVVVVDKTGTVTQGKPQVTDVIATQMPKADFIQLAASLEAPSEHPLAHAVLQYATQNQIDLLPASDFKATAGKGFTATVGEKTYLVGNEAMLKGNDVALPDALRAQVETLAQAGKTPLLFSDTHTVLGVIAVADVVKETSATAIAQLTQMGVEVVMMTGDRASTAKAVQQQVKISKVYAELMPHEKEEKVRAMQAQGKVVAMVGDGINDAPALARADVGVAIGAGTDIAIESADIVLMRSDLQDVVTAIRLSKAVLRNIKENLFWAFFYNSVGIPIAAGVLFPWFGIRLTPMLGAAAMSLSSVCVVLNALRLKNFKTISQKSTVKKEATTMKTITIQIDGMMCMHCSGRVQKALDAIADVTATVNLEQNNAVCTVPSAFDTAVLTDAITQAGYTVTQVTEA